MIYRLKKIIVRLTYLYVFLSFFILHLNAENSKADKWLKAVSKGNDKVAIRLASEMIADENISSTIDPQYAAVAKQENIGPDFFISPFEKYDFKLWYDALFLKNKLKEFGITDSTENHKAVKIIFEKVAARIKPIEKQHAIIPWPTGIWVRQFGLCDRQSWLLAELAYQAGYETQLIYLINPKTGISPHTICEILAKDDNKVIYFTADPYSKILLEKVSVEELSQNRKLMTRIWPKKPNWWSALAQSLFWTPSYPQDYCVKNQILYKILKKKLGKRCPRFGEDPKTRLLKYQKLTNGNKKFKMGLWYYPFRLLKREIDENNNH